MCSDESVLICFCISVHRRGRPQDLRPAAVRYLRPWREETFQQIGGERTKTCLTPTLLTKPSKQIIRHSCSVNKFKRWRLKGLKLFLKKRGPRWQNVSPSEDSVLLMRLSRFPVTAAFSSSVCSTRRVGAVSWSNEGILFNLQSRLLTCNTSTEGSCLLKAYYWIPLNMF